MSFSLRGGKNILWSDEKLAGKTLAKYDAATWHNFGGEKLWPTPQDNFPKFSPKAWPPPYPWDGGASKAETMPDGVRITLATDPRFGAHAVREFSMDPQSPIIHVRQWIEKTEGTPAEMTIWTVAQVNDPKVSILPLGKADAKGQRYKSMGPSSPLTTVDEDVVSLGREARQGLKIGVTSDRIGWAAATFGDVMLVQSHQIVPAAVYPDNGLDTQMYTSPISTARYTELEILGPLVTLKAGEKLRDDAVWQLIPLKPGEADKASDAARIATPRSRRKSRVECVAPGFRLMFARQKTPPGGAVPHRGTSLPPGVLLLREKHRPGGRCHDLCVSVVK